MGSTGTEEAIGGSERGADQAILTSRNPRVRALAAQVARAFGWILIVEDHTLVSDALVSLFGKLGIRARSADTACEDALLRDIAAHAPGAVILDLTLGDDIGDATRLIPAIRELGMAVVVATCDVLRLTAARCYEAGACAVITKGEPFERLLDMLATAADHGRCIEDAEYYDLMYELRQHRQATEAQLAPFARLTRREADVLEHICHGESIEEVADREFVSPTTVRSHLRSIFMKLGVRNQLAAAAAAYETGWIEAREDEKSSKRRATAAG